MYNIGLLPCSDTLFDILKITKTKVVLNITQRFGGNKIWLKAVILTNDDHFLYFHRYRLASGTSEKIQLSSLIAAFQAARNMVVAEA